MNSTYICLTLIFFLFLKKDFKVPNFCHKVYLTWILVYSYKSISEAKT